MGNILNHNRIPFTFRLDRSEYWDFYLSQTSFGSYGNSSGLYDGCLISYIDTTDPECVWFDKLYSKKQYYWDKAVNNGLDLKNIGYTGVDNGLINYKKDRTSNEEFLKLFSNSEFKIEKDDLRLLLNKVYGNNDIFSYDNDIVEEDGMLVSKLNGGFYQGFFRTDDNYKILPRNIGEGITFEIVLKKHDFETTGNKINDRHISNKGIFLYIGTRAENKWWEQYTTDFNKETSANGFIVDGYVNNDYTNTNSLNEGYLKPYDDLYAVSEYFADGYLTDKCDDKNCCCNNKGKRREVNPNQTSMPRFTYPEFLNTYEDNSVWFTNDGHLWIENEHFTTNNSGNSDIKPSKRKCNCNTYFADNYISDDYISESCDCTIYVKDEYLKDEEYIDIDEELFTKDGYSVRQPNIREYRSNNKFLLFDRTCDGFTTENWVEGSETIITDIVTSDIDNFFLLFNRTCDGYTTKTIDELIHKESLKYNVMSDLYRNALAFQITDDGKIGYKYMLKDCNGENDYTIESEWSGEKAVKDDEWNTITIKILPIGKIYDDCVENTSSSDKMRFMIYVNGKLKLVSKELPMLNLKKLNDMYSKQEGVPFSISVGGGTQGLCDVIYLNYREFPKYVLPLEKEFAGTFIGYFKSLRIYNCPITFSEIVQNTIFDGSF